jgi:myo-inositol 2-dehydrogenase/D-chiro-inositol 1-dehydrogenase
VKVGLIGYGAWGSHHAAALAETGGLELAAVCAAGEESRRKAAAEFGVPVVADYRELLALPGLDAVDIVLPTHLHRDVAVAALGAGLHVLLEKPMALDPAECRDILDAWRASRKVLYVGHEFRLSTQWGRMRELVEEGAIGRPLCATIDLWRRPYRLGSDSWRYDRRRVGSWVLEEPIHFFDAVCWWLKEAGSPVSIYAAGSRLSAAPEALWSNMHAVLRFESGAHATVTQTLAVCEHHITAKIIGEEGAVLSFWDGEVDRTTQPRASLKLFRRGTLEEIAIAPSGEFFELRAEMAQFAGCCATGAPAAISPEEAAQAVEICQAAERSIASGAAEPIGDQDKRSRIR